MIVVIRKKSRYLRAQCYAGIKQRHEARLWAQRHAYEEKTGMTFVGTATSLTVQINSDSDVTLGRCQVYFGRATVKCHL